MLVSILIPCFNAEPWIGEAIESALAQTWADKEVIVVDDGSMDGSLGVIKRFDDRIRWESGPNRGGNAARNRLLELARGEWLQYLDADDYLRPEKVQRQAEYATAHPECEIVLSPVVSEIHEADGSITLTEWSFPEPRDPWRLLARWRMPQTGGSLWKKTAIERVGGWRVDQPCCQEHELYLRLLNAGCRFGFCDSRLAVYREFGIPGRVTHKHRHRIVRERLAIVGRAEQSLRSRNELTTERRQDVNDARHELARLAWNAFGDRQLAMEAIGEIAASDPDFQPSPGDASPSLYRLAYRLGGFEFAQRIAATKRGLTSSLRFGYG